MSLNTQNSQTIVSPLMLNSNTQQFVSDNAIITSQNNQNILDNYTIQRIISSQNQQPNLIGTLSTQGMTSIQNPSVITMQSSGNGLVGSSGNMNIQSVGGLSNTGNIQNAQTIQTILNAQGGGTGIQILSNTASQNQINPQSLQTTQLSQGQMQSQGFGAQNSIAIQNLVNSQGLQTSTGSVNSNQASQSINNALFVTQSQASPSVSQLVSSSSSLPPSLNIGSCTPYSCRYDCIQYLGGFYCALDSQSGGISKNVAAIAVISAVCALILLFLIGLIVWKCFMRKVVPYGSLSEVAGAGFRGSAVQGQVLANSMYGGYGSRVMAGASGISPYYNQSGIANYGAGVSNMVGYGNPGAMLIGSGAVHGESMIVQNAIPISNINFNQGVAKIGTGAVGISNVQTRTIGVVDHGSIQGAGTHGQMNVIGRSTINNGITIGSSKTISQGVNHGILSQGNIMSSGLSGVISQGPQLMTQSTNISPIVTRSTSISPVVNINQEMGYSYTNRRMLPSSTNQINYRKY